MLQVPSVSELQLVSSILCVGLLPFQAEVVLTYENNSSLSKLVQADSLCDVRCDVWCDVRRDVRSRLIRIVTE